MKSLKSQIKVRLKKNKTPGFGGGDYRISQLTGAITVDAHKRVNLTVGHFITTEEAEQLNRDYQVTVTQ